MLQHIVKIVPSVLVLVPLSGAEQRAPDLSGNWVLVTVTAASGRGSDTPQVNPDTRTAVNTASGAAFNCGRECTIVHKGQTLTIDKALLGSDNTPAPAVTLELNDRQMSVIDSFSPTREIPVRAKLIGNKLEIISSTGSRAVTQSIAIDTAQLVVVTSFNRDAARPVTLRYRKK